MNPTEPSDATPIEPEIVDLAPSTRKPWMCSATLRDGSGRPCSKPRMVGQTVCASHGGQAPQNIEAARKRLLEAIDPVMAQLIETAMQPNGFCPTCGRMADGLKLRAVLAALDRAFEGGGSTSPSEPQLVVLAVERVLVDSLHADEEDDVAPASNEDVYTVEEGSNDQ